MRIKNFLAPLILALVLVPVSALLLLTLGADSAPLPDREALIAELPSVADEQNAFPLWQQIFVDTSHTVDPDIIQMARQQRPWDSNKIERQILQSAELFPLVRDLRRFDAMRSDYAVDIHSYSYSDVFRIMSVIISAGQWHWQNGQQEEGSELFLDAAHMIKLLYRDEGATLISLFLAQREQLSLVSTLQRLIADAASLEELERLILSANQLSFPYDSLPAKVSQNEALFSRLAFLSHVNTPFSTRLSNAINFYPWWAEDCHVLEEDQQLICGEAVYDTLSYMFPRFYSHWQTFDRHVADQQTRHLEIMAMPCTALHDSTPPAPGARHWSDYFTPDSAIARVPNTDGFVQRLNVNHCLTDFFVSSLQIALALKQYELTYGQPARSLDEVLSEPPQDPFSPTPIRYDWEHQLLWSAGTDGQGERGYPAAPPPSEYTAESALSAHPTYLLRPRPIPAPEKRPSRCEQDPSIPRLDDIESEQGKNEPTQAH
ncbi:MAG: hypothetical protein ACK4SX_10615 [Alcanivoracaceae bacterium]